MTTDPAAWIASARQRADAATAGPWTEEREQDGTNDGWEDSDHATGLIFGPPESSSVDYDRGDEVIGGMALGVDAEFIAAARTDLPAALDALTAVLDVLAACEPPIAGVLRQTIADALEGTR